MEFDLAEEISFEFVWQGIDASQEGGDVGIDGEVDVAPDIFGVTDYEPGFVRATGLRFDGGEKMDDLGNLFSGKFVRVGLVEGVEGGEGIVEVVRVGLVFALGAVLVPVVEGAEFGLLGPEVRFKFGFDGSEEFVVEVVETGEDDGGSEDGFDLCLFGIGVF